MLDRLSAFVIAAPRSGVGKTLVSVALLSYWRARALNVCAGKLGPDYLDAQFLGRASGGSCLNFDAWAMRSSTLDGLLRLPFDAGADLLLVESAMGMFDGAADGKNTGSAYFFASMFSPSLPLVLLLSAKGCGGASLVAQARGFLPPLSPSSWQMTAAAGVDFSTSSKDFPPCALLINDVSSARHADLLKRALRSAFPDTLLLGFLPHRSELFLPSRHLGLVQAEELADLEGLFSRSSRWISGHVDCDALEDFVRARGLPTSSCLPSAGLPPPAQRIAVARDLAFRFLYEGQLELWRRSGVEISFFSPLADEVARADAEWIYLPGGYPELHAGELSSKFRFLQSLRDFSASSARVGIYGECGGYICLGEGLEDAQGRRHEMAGLLPLSVSYRKEASEHGGRRRLFYATGESSHPLFGNRLFRGHVFHTARIEREGTSEGAGEGKEEGKDEECLFSLTDASGASRGRTGLRVGNVCGSFFHVIDRA